MPQKNANNTNSGLKNASLPTYSQSGKRKSVLMNPNIRNVEDFSKAQGVELCEKLFGIKLCHYKQKPPRPNGASVDQVLRDRKVIVQGVVEDSQADICALINRGKYGFKSFNILLTHTCLKCSRLMVENFHIDRSRIKELFIYM